MNAKRFNLITLLIPGILLVITAAFMIIIDPYFHYHKPLLKLEYPMNNEYYMNAGIAKNFDYEIMIAGDSETQNIKASLVENLWGMKTVKLPNPGAPFLETDGVVRFGIRNNKKLKIVIRPLDDYLFTADPHMSRYAKEDMYLYDANPFNDVRYVFNKETVIDAVTVLTYTRAGKKTINFDEYSRTEDVEEYGDFDTLAHDLISQRSFRLAGDTETIYANTLENIKRNIVRTAEENPDIMFYYFILPYSACFWKEIGDNGLIPVAVNCERIALNEMLKYDNIKVFSFMDDYDITTDWRFYCDEIHFSGAVDDYMMEAMYKGEHLITKENVDEYLEGLESFYMTYDYNQMFTVFE
ncbi:MAG: hypothetical protein MJ107_09145 [Lachnospiraceae bacterium]|nr:hypothetical protein [Lachnospiraceae bacterium]